MTAKEIYDSTPWEISMRIKGYEERQRFKRIFTASFITLPIYNTAFNRTRKGVNLEDIIPDDLHENKVTKTELEMWRERLNKAERGKKHG